MAVIFEEDAYWITVKRRIDQVVKLITYYEIKEATTQFELAMWKFNIDQAENPTERAAYRLEVPGPIKDTILQFLQMGVMLLRLQRITVAILQIVLEF